MKNSSSLKYKSDDIECAYAYTVDFSMDVSSHTHTGWEFLFIKNGEMTYTVEGNVFDITPGNLIITRPGAVHMLRSNGTTFYERYFIVVAENLLIKDILEQLPPDLHVLDISDSSIILGLFERVSYYLSNLQEKYMETIFRASVSELLVNIHLHTQHVLQSVTPYSNPVITKTINYIKKHIREPLTVEQIGSALFITPSYLRRCFVKHMNMTPKQYIMLTKLQLVQEALSNAANPTAICRYYGFRSYSTFYRNYQKVFGCSPSNGPQQTLRKIEL